MQQIKDMQKLQDYIKESGFKDCFSFDITKHVKLYFAKAGDFITVEGKSPDNLYYLLTGRAKLYITLSNGKVSLIDFFNAPCFIGELELMDVHKQTCAVEALVPCYLLAIPVVQCKDMLLSDPKFLLRMCIYLGEKNFRNVFALSQTKAFPLKNRLAEFLLLASSGGVYREPHAQAAEYLGVTYRHLLFVLSEFVKDKIIEKTDTGYRIVDLLALKQLAQTI